MWPTDAAHDRDAKPNRADFIKEEEIPKSLRKPMKCALSQEERLRRLEKIHSKR